MLRLKCRYTRARINALINQELLDHERRVVARHVDECAECRAKFEHERELKRELERQLPVWGAPSHQALNRIWANLEATMTLPDDHIQPAQQANGQSGYTYLVCICVMMLLFMVPYGFGRTPPLVNTLPEQPAPDLIENSTTVITPPAIPTVIALAHDESVTPTIFVNLLANTPAPNTPPN